MLYHNSCDTISIFCFRKIIDTGDYSFLAKKRHSNFVKDVGSDKLSKAWKSIYKEYCEITNDNRSLEYYRLTEKLLYLEARREVVSKLFTQIAIRKMNDLSFLAYITEIKAWGFKYNGVTKVLTEMEDLGRQIKSTSNRINTYKSRLKAFSSGDKSPPLGRIVLDVEQALGKNRINTKKTTVVDWIYMFDKIKSINEERNKKTRN